MSEFCLRADGLSKNYGKVEALKGADFYVRKGAITCFLGENGAGKTTAIKCVLGFLRCDSGRVEVERGKTGYVPEYPEYFNWLEGEEILLYTAKLFGIPEERLRREIDDMSERLAFDIEQLSRKVHTYSLGNRKKFSYLQSLVISPDFLVVDEPFYSLDPISIKKVRELFVFLKGRGASLFLSSHLIAEVEKIADEVIIIKKGTILIQENLQELRENYLFVRLPVEWTDRERLGEYSKFVREREGRFELVVEKARLGALGEFLDEESKEITLEKLFLFFH